jgi:hypothetical protein
MGLVQPPRPRGSLIDRFRELGPGGQVQRGAGSVAAALARAQMEGLDPRSWNDRVTPEYDEAGRPISAGVMFPRNPLNAVPLEKIFRNRGEVKYDRPDFRDKEILGTYGDDQRMMDFNEAETQLEGDILRDILQGGSWGPLGGDRSKLPVSWDGPKRPLPPPPLKGALDELLDKLRPKQMKQMKVFDDDELDFGPNWWEQGGNPFDQPYHAQPGASPLETDNPKLFRPIANHPLEQEEWIKKTAHRGDEKIPGAGPRADANAEMKQFGRKRYWDRRVERIRDQIRAGDELKVPPPPHPMAYDENYYKGAELNFVPKKPTIVQQLQRISRGRRGGV